MLTATHGVCVSKASRLDRGRGSRGEWARATHQRYERIVRLHIEGCPDPSQPLIGSLPLADLTADRVAEWSQANERVLAPTTAVIALITLNQVCRFPLRRGWLTQNPVSLLEPCEKPRWTPQPVGVLEGADLARVLEHAGSYRPLFTLLACTGLRIGEALGLVWGDVDFEAALLRVHRQLSRYRTHARLKTEAAEREVVLAPALVRLLRERQLASPFKGAEDFLFANALGRGLDHRIVGEAFPAAGKAAALGGQGRLSLHSLRHGGVRVAAHRQGPGRGVRLPPARPREPRRVPLRLRPPVRPARARPGATEALEASDEARHGS